MSGHGHRSRLLFINAGAVYQQNSRYLLPVSEHRVVGFPNQSTGRFFHGPAHPCPRRETISSAVCRPAKCLTVPSSATASSISGEWRCVYQPTAATFVVIVSRIISSIFQVGVHSRLCSETIRDVLWLSGIPFLQYHTAAR